MCQNKPPISPTLPLGAVAAEPPVPVVPPPPGLASYSFPPFPNQLPQGEWSSGLCDCLDDPSICVATAFLPCVTMGKIAHMVDRGTISCFAASMIYIALGYAGCASMYGCTYRTKLRGLFGLPEGSIPDGLVHCLCCFCALCQDYRELKNRGADPSLGWEVNVEKWNQEGITAPPVVEPGMAR
ncbi:hypothetical protein ACSBR2_035980 [Camellia fascicularis]